MDTQPATIYGESSWTISSPHVTASVSQRGGMMAPVRFTLPAGSTVEPYYINPWWNEDTSAIEPALLRPLRGDFFCLPFGAPNERGDEQHEPHGLAASGVWNRVETGCGPDRLEAVITYRDGRGRITKRIRLAADTPAVYTEHLVEGFAGRYPLGHHATLQGAQPDEEASEPIWRVITSPFDIGMADPGATRPSAAGEYYALEPGGRFEALHDVPTRWKSPVTTDCSRFPAREGFIDILTLYRRPHARIAWTVAVNLRDGYAWYSIKDQSVLPHTVMWMENRGRHGAPWNGRNSCLGLEETCSYFAAGLSAPDDGGTPGDVGIPTAVDLQPDEPLVVRTIQGVFAVDDPEMDIVALDAGAFVDGEGRRYETGVDERWVATRP